MGVLGFKLSSSCLQGKVFAISTTPDWFTCMPMSRTAFHSTGTVPHYLWNYAASLGQNGPETRPSLWHSWALSLSALVEGSSGCLTRDDTCCVLEASSFSRWSEVRDAGCCPSISLSVLATQVSICCLLPFPSFLFLVHSSFCLK